jgi:hypothetical protein
VRESLPFEHGTPGIPEATLAHEMGHAYLIIKGRNLWSRQSRELDGTAIENQYRGKLGMNQRNIYTPGVSGFDFNVPQYDYNTAKFRLNGRDYRLKR